MPDLEKCSGAEVSKGGPVRPALRLTLDLTSSFPPDRLVRELLDRWWSLHVGSRGSSHSIGGLSGADLRNSVNLAVLRARRLAQRWHPGGWTGKGPITEHQLRCPICRGEQDSEGRVARAPLRWHAGCPVERFYQARDRVNRVGARARRAMDAAAGYQLRHVDVVAVSPRVVNWDPRQNPRRDTPLQAKARTLWDRADALWKVYDAAEQDPAFDLVVQFLAIVLVLWSVHEDPESFARYAIP